MINNVLNGIIGQRILADSCPYSLFNVNFQVGDYYTTSNVKPFYGLNNYSINANIYSPSQMPSYNCNITGIQVYFQSFTTPYSVNNQEIWIGEISNTTFPTSTPQVDFSDLTFVKPLVKVKDSFTCNITTNGLWYTFNFNTPYCYSGTGSLLIVWKNYDGTWSSGYGSTHVANIVSKSMYKGSDVAFPTGTGTRDNYPLLIKFNAKLNNLFDLADAIYSFRKLNPNYTGYCIKIRRSNDNALLDIGFDSNGDLDVFAIYSFVGSNLAYVHTEYDQSGNNYDRVQTTNANQPKIVDTGGVLITINGKPAMFFDGTNDHFLQQSPALGDSASVFSVFKLDNSYSTTDEHPLFGATSNYGNRFGVNVNKWFLINNTTNSGISSTSNVDTNQNVSSVLFGATDKVRINGTEVLSGNAGTSGSSATYIGRSWLGKYFKGYIQEMVFFTKDQTDNVLNIETNITNYYGI